MTHASILRYLFFSFIVCLGITSFLIFPPYGMDDCYITYRYAYNLFHHQQFVFNLGERILGTTSPLYTLILTIAQIFSDNIPRMSNAISCVCASLAGFLLFLVLKKDNLLVGIFCALSYPFILQDIGLETNFLMFLFAAAVCLFARGNYLLCGAVLGLCFLTRQDSAIFIGVMIWMYRLKNKRLPWREFAVFSIVTAPWFIFSHFYFDSLAPTSLQAKMGYTDFAGYFINALAYLARYCDRYNFYLLSFLSRGISPFLLPVPFFASTTTVSSLAMLYLLFMLFSLTYYLKHAAQHHYAGALLYLYPLSMIIMLSVIGPPAPPGHAWHLTGAINFALIGQLNLFTTPLLARLKKSYPASMWTSGRPVFVYVLLSCYLICFTILNLKDFYTVSHYANRAPWFGARYNNYKHIGCFLKDAASDDETVFVLEVGTIGYYSMKRMIDGAGLISPGYGKYHRAGCWLMGMKRGFPDYIVTGDFEVPFYEPVSHFQNNFMKTVVYRKLKSLPENDYPFPQLCRNWNDWKGRR